MEVSTFKNLMLNNKLNDFYVFAGDEWYAQQIYIQQLAKIRKSEIKYVDSISDIWQKLHTPSFIKKYYVYVLRDDKAILTDAKVQELLLNNSLDGNMLILLVTQFDKRLKRFKTLHDRIVIFDKLTLETLKKHIKQTINLNDQNCERLIDICCCDLGRIMLEVNKIKHLDSSDVNAAFEMLVNTGGINVSFDSVLYDLVDSIMTRNVLNVYKLLEIYKNSDESVLGFIQILYTSIKQMLQVQSCDYDIEQTTGIPQWQIKKIQSKSGYYRIGELVDGMRLLQNVERRLKLGEIEESVAIDYILVNIL